MANLTEVEARLMSHEQVCAVRYEGTMEALQADEAVRAQYLSV